MPYYAITSINCTKVLQKQSSLYRREQLAFCRGLLALQVLRDDSQIKLTGTPEGNNEAGKTELKWGLI